MPARGESRGEPQWIIQAYLSAQSHTLVHNSSANATCASCDQALSVLSKVGPACHPAAHGPCEALLSVTEGAGAHLDAT